MARRKDKEKAIQLRLQGWSYSQIKKKLKVSKSTLSYWLRDMPLSAERIKSLQSSGPRRIEKFRNTMREKRQIKLKEAYDAVSGHIGALSDREIIIGGFFLYWGEGTKRSMSCLAMSNTDPAIQLFFLKWMEILGVPRSRMRVKLHLYSDMNIDESIDYWSNLLGISKSNFLKSYIKQSRQLDINYKREFVKGTCMISYHNQKLHDFVMMGLKYLQDTSKTFT